MESFTSPWLHPEATPAVREVIRLRYRLMPYFLQPDARGDRWRDSVAAHLRRLPGR